VVNWRGRPKQGEGNISALGEMERK